MAASERREGQTILLVGAGCAAGAIVAKAFARQNARVVLVDHDEAPILQIARSDPGRLDPLKLDIWTDAPVQHMAGIWGQEPLPVLIQMQALRAPRKPAEAIGSVIRVSQAFGPAVRAARGRELILYPALPAQAPLALRAYSAALTALAPLMQAQSGPGVQVCALEIAGKRDARSSAELRKLVLWMCAPDAPVLGGTVMRLGQRSD